MSPAQRIVPPVYFLASLLAMLALHRYAPIARIVEPPLTWLGLVPLVLGLATAIAGARAFGRTGTTVRPFREASALVTDGIFRVSRNPMYLGMISALLGVAILLGTLGAFLPVPLFFFVLQRWFVRPEEKMLERLFGEHYLDYRRRVRRWM
ncbi:methyltransferase family protein [Lentisalinibacter orientalis]|uniref:methyltransferase family protein n=1 Tax=Lentisalinibacter orientalis TaxID=2992241 RepID=UPI00386FCE56